MKAQKGLPLLELGTAYKSLRESGFDFSTAIGELIDNSLQAKAKKIEIRPKIEERKFEGRRKPIPVIIQVVVVDNGNGMNTETLNGCPQLGYSTRYNDREGLGRFGVGATYASISQCKRTTFYSRPNGTGDFKATYIDLDEIANKTQTDIPKPIEVHLPKDLKEISSENTSTIVVWDNCDRLESDANGKPINSESHLKELKKWISRAYRHFIWKGVEIYIDEEEVVAYDPLYSITEQTKFPDDQCAKEWFSKSLDWAIPGMPDKTSSISIKLTLLPEEWRTKPGVGRSRHATERGIPDNEGISILRHNREVAYRNLYPTVPGQQDIDRWWGCEINFEPELDECWEVRNIKRGAKPIKELSDVLKEILRPEIVELRKEVQNYWKTGIPLDIVKHVYEIASTSMEKNGSTSAPEIKSLLSEMDISFEKISQLLEDLAGEKNWDWTTDGTHRSYYAPSSQQLSKLESEREACFEDISRAIKDSNIDQEFKDVALYDLEQAKVSYENRAFKASIVMFGAIAEGLMLGMLRKETTLIPMISDPKNAPKVVQRLGLKPSSKPEEIADRISEKLKFEDYKNIISELKPEIERLEIQRIQKLRNTIHPWKSITEPKSFRDPGPTIAINCLSSLSLLTENILA